MRILNTRTNQDVTSYYLQFMQDEITKEEFEKLSGLDAKNLRIKIKK